MPIYINDNEQALFKGDEKTSVCMIHGSDMSRPNAYYFESCENNEDITTMDSNNVHNIEEASTSTGILKYKPWVKTVGVLTYSRDDNCPIINWSQKGIVRCFKDLMHIGFYDLNGNEFSIKGERNGKIDTLRKYTAIPLTALGEKLFTCSEVNIFSFKKGTIDITSEFYNDTRIFSFVSICNEPYSNPDGYSVYYYNNGYLYNSYNEPFSPFTDKFRLECNKQICQEGVDRPSGKSKYIEGYNTLTHNFVVTIDDIKNIPPYMWRYTYIIDATDLHMGAITYNKDTGDAWWVFHKSYMTNNGDNYFDKYIKNSNNFFVYLDYRKCEAIREVTSDKNTQTYLVTKENQNEMIEECFLGAGKLVTFTNLIDSSLLYMKYNFWGDFSENTLTYKKSTYPQVSFDLHYLKFGSANILNIIMNFWLRITGVGNLTYKTNAHTSILVYSADGIELYKNTSSSSGKDINVTFLAVGNFPDKFVCMGNSVLDEVIYSDEKYEICDGILSNDDFTKYSSFNYTPPRVMDGDNVDSLVTFEKTEKTIFLSKREEEDMHTCKSQTLHFKISIDNEISSFVLPFVLTFQGSDGIHYTITVHPFYSDYNFMPVVGDTILGISELTLYLYLAKAKKVQQLHFYEYELINLINSMIKSGKGSTAVFKDKMPNAYKEYKDFISSHYIYFFMENPQKLSIDDAREMAQAKIIESQKLVLNKNLDGYNCFFPPIVKIMDKDNSKYDSYKTYIHNYTESELGVSPNIFVDMQLYDIQVAKKNG